MLATFRMTAAAATLAIGALAAASAGAAVTIYQTGTANTAANFLVAASPYQVETFTTGTPLNAGLTITSSQASYSGDVMNDWVGVDPNNGLPNPPSFSTIFSFASAITAFGGDFDLSEGGPGTGITVTITLAGGDVVVGEVPSSTNGGVSAFVGFWGFTSSEGFTSVVFSAGSTPAKREAYSLDNLTYSQFREIPVPEPASLALLGLGLAGLVAARRRRETA